VLAQEHRLYPRAVRWLVEGALERATAWCAIAAARRKLLGSLEAP
jgi:folate-dependent phosphoribosylglycinamide formyltransferase PurN